MTIKAVIVSNRNLVFVSGAALSFLAGGGSGFLLGKKLLERKYQDLADVEVREAKDYYEKRYAYREKPDPEEIAEKYTSESEVPEEIVVTENVNIFLNAREDTTLLVIEDEVREPNQPYVITVDEFMENEGDRMQAQITYYRGDGVLADEKDAEIHDIARTIGLPNLERFGHGSNDVRIVYIRDEAHDLEFEVILSEGKYSEEVLGEIDHEIHHSSDRRELRRFRSLDE